MPMAVAIQCVEVTTPNVPSISGRVVNALGLMTLIPNSSPISAMAKYARGAEQRPRGCGVMSAKTGGRHPAADFAVMRKPAR